METDIEFDTLELAVMLRLIGKQTVGETSEPDWVLLYGLHKKLTRAMEIAKETGE